MIARTSRPVGGFTLIEVVVALAILGIVVVTIVKNTTDGIVSTGAVRDRVLAGIVAENRMIEETLAEPPPPIGTTEGVEVLANRSWTWSRRLAATPDPGLLRLEIDVRDADAKEVLASLSALRGSGRE